MSLSILNNIPSLVAQNQLSITNTSLQRTLSRLSSGSRINSGADDAAGLAIADGLKANIMALSQSARNATDGVGKLQVADGALAQVTSLMNRAVTLATEASTGTVTSEQRSALDAEYQAIKAEIDRIGSKTTFNGDTIFTGASSVSDTNVFATSVGALTTATTLTAAQTLTITDTKTGVQKSYSTDDYTTLGDLMTAIQGDAGTGVGQVDVSVAIVGGNLQIKDASGDRSLFMQSDITELGGAGGLAAATRLVGGSSVFLSDGGSGNSDTISTTIATLSSDDLLLSHDLTSDTNAQAALTEITAAVAQIASQRGDIGAGINRLQSASNVIHNQVQNLSNAEDAIRAADIAEEVANMTKYNILTQTGMAALAQSNQTQQAVLTLLR